MIRFITLVFAFFVFGFAQGSAQETSKSSVGASARELFVGCSLLLRGDELENSLDSQKAPKHHSAVTCTLETGYQLTFFSGKSEGFCPPKDAGFVGNPIAAVAGVYLAWFERYAERVASLNGRPAMLLALKTTWPCK